MSDFLPAAGYSHEPPKLVEPSSTLGEETSGRVKQFHVWLITRRH